MEERIRMERKCNPTIFSGCVGFLECVLIKSVWERKDNFNQEREEPTDEELKCDFEVWIDLDDYCWSWSTVPVQKNRY